MDLAIIGFTELECVGETLRGGAAVRINQLDHRHTSSAINERELGDGRVQGLVGGGIAHGPGGRGIVRDEMRSDEGGDILLDRFGSAANLLLDFAQAPRMFAAIEQQQENFQPLDRRNVVEDQASDIIWNVRQRHGYFRSAIGG